jgi:hypothetical protein
MKILIITPDKTDSTSYYRAAGITKNLQRQFPVDIQIVDWTSMAMTWADLIQFDLVFMQRPFHEMALQMAEYLKGLKIPLWVDYDDNLFEVPRGIQPYDLFTRPDIQKNIRTLLSMANVVTVSTAHLKESLTKYNKNIIVIKNAIDLDTMGERNINEKKNIVMWRGSKTHIIDVMYVQEHMRKIYNDCDWRFVFMGFDNFWLSGDRYTYLKAVDPFKYYQMLKAMNISCMQVPLIDIPFNHSKSNIAAIEGTWAGGVCIVPDWEEWQIPGMLKYKDRKQYSQRLNAVVNNKVDIEKRNSQAWEYICDELSLQKQNKLRIEILKNI